jgi:hypothetical protein
MEMLAFGQFRTKVLEFGEDSNGVGEKEIEMLNYIYFMVGIKKYRFRNAGCLQ